MTRSSRIFQVRFRLKKKEDDEGKKEDAGAAPRESQEKNNDVNIDKKVEKTTGEIDVEKKKKDETSDKTGNRLEEEKP